LRRRITAARSADDAERQHQREYDESKRDQAHDILLLLAAWGQGTEARNAKLSLSAATRASGDLTPNGPTAEALCSKVGMGER